MRAQTMTVQGPKESLTMFPLTYDTAQTFSPYRFGMFAAAPADAGQIASVSPGAQAQPQAPGAGQAVTLREGQGPLGMSTTTWLLIGAAAIGGFLLLRKGRRRK